MRTSSQSKTVSQVASVLKGDGLIDYSRGMINILDRDGLTQRACECHATTGRFRRLIETQNTEGVPAGQNTPVVTWSR